MIRIPGGRGRGRVYTKHCDTTIRIILCSDLQWSEPFWGSITYQGRSHGTKSTNHYFGTKTKRWAEVESNLQQYRSLSVYQSSTASTRPNPPSEFLSRDRTHMCGRGTNCILALINAGNCSLLFHELGIINFGSMAWCTVFHVSVHARVSDGGAGGTKWWLSVW